MKINQHLKQFLGLIFMFFFVLILSTRSHAELSVESYCQLTLKSAEQEISNLNELIILAEQYSDDQDVFLYEEEREREKFDGGKKVLFESFNTTAEEYIAFMGKNGRKVEQYLGNHPEITQTIDDFSDQVNTLLEEYESLKEDIIDMPPFIEPGIIE